MTGAIEIICSDGGACEIRLVFFCTDHEYAGGVLYRQHIQEEVV